jgi:hypothetical protein
MRCRLISIIFLFAANGIFVPSGWARSKVDMAWQDAEVIKLIFGVRAAIDEAPRSDEAAQTRRALVGSLSFLMVQLERSKTEEARRSAAALVFLDCDAGCSSDRTDVMLAHGVALVPYLRGVRDQYQYLCPKGAVMPCVSMETGLKYAQETAEMLGRSTAKTVR